jgi:hypothetical protein
MNMKTMTFLNERYADDVIGDGSAEVDSLELHGVRHLESTSSTEQHTAQVDDNNPQFYSVYTRMKSGEVSCIGDFSLYGDAKDYAEDIGIQFQWPLRDFCCEMPFLERHCFGLATSMFISGDNGFEGTWFERYQFLAKCVEDEIEPEEWSPWEPFEYWEWQQIVSEIENQADSFLHSFKYLMELTHQGIIQSACDDTLGLDMTLINLERMLEMGNAMSNLVSASGAILPTLKLLAYQWLKQVFMEVYGSQYRESEFQSMLSWLEKSDCCKPREQRIVEKVARNLVSTWKQYSDAVKAIRQSTYPRDFLELEARKNCAADDHYDLADYIENMSDGELMIIARIFDE